ncbi:hypothetical protein A2853_00685 [Candidatus Kaiserbacteria bacterium RIFCSPHIGHO2_01_FULL_55_17]|uniref:Uncharacterized protein n=1 Tax=Candidatus Kaiserbacteria bacterium RIFCSPHIGHO2_01_FULL_55_17 TaxID=1798484 RepID=A0A1F6DA55_9BACT|nr:MAG: hypothetical protein A2853_00685 [Candidatus Kaiserbacteria bacterium RIFCSPHIGHO2_01_FULL_55_17]
MKSSADRWLPSKERQKELIKELAPKGVPRLVFRNLFQLGNSSMSGRAERAKIRFSDYLATDVNTMRKLLIGVGAPEAEVDRVLQEHQASAKRHPWRRNFRRLTGDTSIPPGKAGPPVDSVKVAAIPWPTDAEVTAEAAREIGKAAKKASTTSD